MGNWISCWNTNDDSSDDHGLKDAQVQVGKCKPNVDTFTLVSPLQPRIRLLPLNPSLVAIDIMNTPKDCVGTVLKKGGGKFESQ